MLPAGMFTENITKAAELYERVNQQCAKNDYGEPFWEATSFKITHGSADRHGRWKPDIMLDCCAHIVVSRAHPDSFVYHFKTLTHISHLFGITERELHNALVVRRFIRDIDSNTLFVD